MAERAGAATDRLCDYGGPRDLEEQAALERWRLQRGLLRPLTGLEIALALAEANPEEKA